MIGKLFVISASSGAGKTTLVTAIITHMGGHVNLERVVTYTTRTPAPGDVPGVDYHFVTPAQFQEKIAAGFFMEWSTAYGHYYGSPRSVLDEVAAGNSRILILDRAGA